MWQWLYKLGSPKWFYDMTGRFMPWLAGVTLILLTIGLVWGLGFAPPDYQMGDNFRIIYIHVPTASLSLGCYAMMACMAASYMIWKIKMADIVAKVCAPIGASFTAVMLLSGAFWGKPTWGTYWVWEGRLTSALILFFIYIGVMALRSAYDSEESGAKASSVLTLVGVVNLPIIRYSVDWWQSLHQPSSSISVESTAANPPEIWIPIFFSGFALIGIFLMAVILRTRNEILLRERKTSWVEEIVLANQALKHNSGGRHA